MASLSAMQSYGLNSDLSDKTVLIVKLTDSALESIQEHIKAKISQPPTLHLSDNQHNGSIHIPTLKDGKVFGFTLKPTEDLQSDAQSCFECIQQTGPKSLKSIGLFQNKMQIQASEDSFEKTKTKMAIAEQEVKKNCTKVIKQTGGQFDIAKRAKTKRPYSSTISTSSPIASYNKIASSKSVTPPTRPDSNHSNGTMKMSSNSSTKNIVDTIATRLLKDRVVHCLGLKNYNKPELMAKLMKDGLKEAEKKILNTICTQYGSWNGVTYTLNKTGWLLVQDNWPFYTPEELDYVMKRKRSHTQQIQPSSQPETNNISPANSTSPSMKKPPGPSPISEPPSKKLKPYKSHDNPSHSFNNSHSNSNGAPHTNGDLTNGHHHNNKKSNGTHAPAIINNVPVMNGSYKHHNGYGHHNDRSKSSQENLSSPDRSPGSSRDSLDSVGSAQQRPTYETQYSAIRSPEERVRYKNVFNSDYQEYLDLHLYITEINKSFEDLHNKLRTSNKETDEHKVITHQIQKAFKAKMNDKFNTKTSRLLFLDKKLTHIKNLIRDYDHQINN